MNHIVHGHRGTCVRKKALFALALTLINMFGLLIMVIQFDNMFLLPLFGVMVIGGVYLLSLRCPHCSERIYKRKTRIQGIEVTYWGGFLIPVRCSRCGKDLCPDSGETGGKSP